MEAPHALPPGPRGLPLLGVLPHLIRDPLTTCMDNQRRYGGVVRLPVLRGSVYLVTEPELVEQVLVRSNANQWKGRLFRRADFLFGDGLVLNDGPSWQHQRRIMQPGFHASRLRQAVPAMVTPIEDMLERWDRAAQDGVVIELESEMTTLTLDLMTTAMFNTRLSPADLAATGRAFGIVLNHIALRFATFTFDETTRLPGERRPRRALTTLDSVVDRLIDQRRSIGSHDDVLGLLIEAVDTGAMSRKLLRDEVITLLFGGYEATAHALAWSWYLLDRYPDVGDRVRAESAAVAPADVEQLVFTRRVIDETLRLYPSFWNVLRSTHEAQAIGEFEIPANASLLLVPWVTHRLPGFWPDPLAFRPDRWDRPPAHRYAYYPFGAGQRLCLGRPLALIEMQLVISLVSRRFRLRRNRNRDIRYRAQSTLRSRGGIWMNVERL
jgi:enediyne biosynthesis protein E7